MPTSQAQTQRTELENQIKNDFSELQKKLGTLKSEIQTETDQTKKQEKEVEIQKMEKDLANMEEQIDKLSSLQDEALQSLKDRLEQYKQVRQYVQGKTIELLGEKNQIPTTYELIKDSETYNRLLTVISSNPKEFANLQGETAEAKLEYIFSQIRKGVTLFLKNKLGNSEKNDKVINNTIAPALEWCLMEMLRDQGNDANTNMLQGMNKISWNSLNNLITGVGDFAKKTKGSFNKFSQWMNALDYLSVHNGVLNKPEKSAVLASPLEFKNYLNDGVFASEGFSPYNLIDNNIFKVEENQTFEFGISLQEKQNILNQIGNIQVVNSPKTTALIVKMLDKHDKFFGASAGLQKVANGLLDGANALNSVTKIVGIDLIGEINRPAEQRGFWFRIIDFVCKLIGFTGGLEGMVKKWRLDKLNLTDEKNENISKIFQEYQNLAGKGSDVSITDGSYCSSVLANFALTDLDKTSSTKGDHLRDVMAKNIDINQIPVSVVQQTLGNDYLKKEVITVNGKQQEKISVDVSKMTEDKKRELTHLHIGNMKKHLEENYSDLKDFYSTIHNTDDLVICFTAALYADKEDVIEGVKAKVFLPENYGVTYPGNIEGMAVDNIGQTGNYSGEEGNNGLEKGNNGGNQSGRESLDSSESSDKQKVTEQWIYDKAVEYGITDNRQIAYILSTIKGESGFKNQKEIGGESKKYGKVDSETGKSYYGRGFIQITHKGNYEKYTQIIRESGRDFKDNEGNTIKGSEIDLVNNPDVILQSNDLAIFIAMDWMKNGGPSRTENKKLDYYISDSKVDFLNARKIINGTDGAKKFEKYAQDYLARLGNGNIEYLS